MSGGGGSGVDAAAFAALALSSPDSWRTVRFVRTWRGADRPDGVRGWIRRPDALRVEDLHGGLMQASFREPGPDRSSALLTLGDGDGPPDLIGAERDDSWLPMHMRRPEAPFFQDYHWVAMLDPYELAVGSDPETGASPPPLSVEEVLEVDHHGRAALQAEVRTLPGYDPRCSCCPLLFGAETEALTVEEGGGRLLDRDPDLRYADRHLVRLDLGTGICVRTEQVGGSRDGEGHEVVLEAVDEDLPDELFVGDVRRRGRRRALQARRR